MIDDAPFQPASRSPVEIPEPVLPDRADLKFSGFTPDAFQLLERLRAHPHIAQYQKDKEGIYEHLKEPFKVYRDDVVVNFVLPNRLDLETERNVFSRLLKNDFGAGGCHHHLWLSFYRPERTRLTDIQLAHSIWPDGLRISVYAGQQARDAFDRAIENVRERPERFLEEAARLLAGDHYTLTIYPKSGTAARFTEPLDTVPDAIEGCRGIAISHEIARSVVLERGARIVENVLDAMAALWPVYRFFIN